MAAALIAAVALAQTPAPTMSAEALVQWLEGRATGYSGAVLIARGDQVLVERAFGDADRRGNRKNTPATRFNLGSINKTFTAVGIAQMIDAGKVSLDDTLAKVLPEYPNRNAAATITLRDIMAHRSGIAQFLRADFGDVTVADMVRRVAAEPHAFAPGTRQQYSNGGYIVLGRVLEVASGEPYEAFVREHIYKPAGMTGAAFLTEADSATAAFGYYGVDASGQPMMGPTPVGYAANRITKGNPAGGGYATPADLFKFSRALKSGRLLSARMTGLVCNDSFAGDPAARFGFALREQLAGSRRFIGNGGGAPGVNAEFRFEPHGEYTIVALSNASPPAATQMLSDILAKIAPGADSPAAAAPSGPSRARRQGVPASFGPSVLPLSPE
jgi:CubicO group peptidase (beta-lactamase class C family)